MFPARIVAIRKQHKLTQETLAMLLGVTRSAVSLWEIDKRVPDIEMLKKIATTFHVSVDWLLGRVDSPDDSLIPVTTEPIDHTAERANNPAMDEILDNLQLMSQDDIENFRRLTRSVVNRKTKGVS